MLVEKTIWIKTKYHLRILKNILGWPTNKTVQNNVLSYEKSRCETSNIHNDPQSRLFLFHTRLCQDAAVDNSVPNDISRICEILQRILDIDRLDFANKCTTRCPQSLSKWIRKVIFLWCVLSSHFRFRRKYNLAKQNMNER